MRRKDYKNGDFTKYYCKAMKKHYWALGYFGGHWMYGDRIILQDLIWYVIETEASIMFANGNFFNSSAIPFEKREHVANGKYSLSKLWLIRKDMFFRARRLSIHEVNELCKEFPEIKYKCQAGVALNQGSNSSIHQGSNSSIQGLEALAQNSEALVPSSILEKDTEFLISVRDKIDKRLSEKNHKSSKIFEEGETVWIKGKVVETCASAGVLVELGTSKRWMDLSSIHKELSNPPKSK